MSDTVYEYVAESNCYTDEYGEVHCLRMNLTNDWVPGITGVDIRVHRNVSYADIIVDDDLEVPADIVAALDAIIKGIAQVDALQANPGKVDPAKFKLTDKILKGSYHCYFKYRNLKELETFYYAVTIHPDRTGNCQAMSALKAPYQVEGYGECPFSNLSEIGAAALFAQAQMMDEVNAQIDAYISVKGDKINLRYLSI